VNAIKKIHFPEKLNDKNQGLSRLIYEEFLFFQIAIQYKKYKEKFIFKNFSYDQKANEIINNFINNLPFQLTNAQKKVIEEIKNDMFSKFKMNRLIQGDVGSGKTIVAAVAIFYAILSNYQVAVMAPTDILAHQHYSTFKKLFANFNFNISLLVHKINKKEKNLIYENLRNGQINLIIGTHALFQKNVYFKNIKLVVIDEQHRFGVQQREELIKKGFDVDVLMLTATPIPRTLTLTIYGDTDVSIIDELPPHKKMIKTFVRKEKDRINIFNFIKEKIKNENEQVFIICPLISKSNKSNFKDVENYFKEISSNYFKEFNCAFLHSKIKNKDEIIEQFRKNEINILVSTTVIEVGIDIPSANIIIIEDANKFGLSQLHQLRGRVGRGNKESYCILIINDNISKLAETRIKTLEKYNDGFKISEIDLFLRGTGELTGIKQSGLSEFQFGNLLKNKKELLYAFYDAKKIIETDSFKSKMLIKKSIKKFGNKIDKIFV
ncbi:MAG TPA: ATP-dependent DNA helicase RecG, partial [bacterium]|nr:ATP-dependent DNA helicase RecG [bacterium]